jgi:hypothetical protein
MVVFRRGLALLASTPLLASLASTPAAAQAREVCRVVNVDFTMGGLPAGKRPIPPETPDQAKNQPEVQPQIVAWLEKTDGTYVDTIYVTEKTGRYGIGNRPGRFDFNSGPLWPYGRRTTLFPIWANRHGQSFPQLEFQGGGDDALSHSSGQSSRESHFCRPMLESDTGWDTATCASSVSYTDKGVFGTQVSKYPPRSDVIPTANMDSPSVQQFKAMNPFDAVSQATPRVGAAAQMSWAVPAELPMGDYVLFVEVALEQDFNTSYPPNKSPMVAYGEYGVPYIGQPSVVYRVPFTMTTAKTIATTDTYVGYADPKKPGELHAPDATITTGTPNVGASRLLMMSVGGQTFRLRVDAHPEEDFVAPDRPGEMIASEPSTNGVTLSFVAPGDDGVMGRVKGYEVRYRAGDEPITDADFNQATEARPSMDIVAPGEMQQIVLKDLLPETDYTVAVRAYDDCHNTSQVTTATFSTSLRRSGEVDACFIATAAYGSLLANDVDLLRRFRDGILKRSVLGELAVETYYTFGPSVAGVVGESDLLRATARDLLSPLVSRVKRMTW